MYTSFAKRQIEKNNTTDFGFLLLSIIFCILGYYSLNTPTDLIWYSYLIRNFFGIVLLFIGTFAFSMSLSFVILRRNPNFSLKIGEKYFFPVAVAWLGTNAMILVLSLIASFQVVPFMDISQTVYYILINLVMVFVIYNIE